MRYKFHGNYSSKSIDEYQKAQEEDLIKIRKYLQTENSKLGKISFEVYDTREGKQKADPNHSISRASARFNEMRIYRCWLPGEDPHCPHEITHLVAHIWAKPYPLKTELDTSYGTKIIKKIEMLSTSFIQEGLAIAVDDIVFGRKLLEEGEKKYIDDWCRKQMNKMPVNIHSVIDINGFDSLPNKIVVPFSASLSKFLLNKFGLNKYKKMYVKIKETLPPEENVRMIENEYRQSEEKLVNNWRKSIT